MESATKSLDRIKTGYEHFNNILDTKEHTSEMDGVLSDEDQKVILSYRESFEKSMDDDFNTSGAIATIFDMVKFGNTELKDSNSLVFINEFVKLFSELCDILGITYKREALLLDSDIEALIEERQMARKNRDFARADEIRDDLLNKGIVLEDTREGVRFKRV